MLDHAREAVAVAEGCSRADLDADRKLELSLARLVEIIGEAAARVTPSGRERLPALPWADIVSFRKRLIHGYDEVELDILWATVSDDLPALITALSTHLEEDADGAT